MKFDLLYAKFASKYAQDTMRVPPHPEVKERPIIVEEVIPPPPKVPSFSEPMTSNKSYSPTKDLSFRQAFDALFFQCARSNLFSEEEMDAFRDLNNDQESFDHVVSELKKKLQTAQNCLQKAEQLNSRIFK